ncbi:hypothetical protein FACS189427_10590 [Planctomycetales bacterium]|nr:hypothetical protein FACS189427_10590 [Planctomycetales bacterium]
MFSSHKTDNKTVSAVIIYLLFSFAAFLSIPETAYCGSWASELFPVKRHDFGRVVLGTNAVFSFPLENRFQEDIRILNAQSSCGCTSVSVPKKILKSGENSSINAQLNTTGQHLYEKSAVITVFLETVVQGRTLHDTVQLSVSGYIRPDVVISPGIAEFGSILEGQTAERILTLEYSGRPDWALTKIERSNPFIYAKAEEIKRSGGDIAYKITVSLRQGAEPGYLKDALRFATNEKTAGHSKPSEIILLVQGAVIAPLRANPSPFMAGILTEGENVTKSLVVRSEKPFRIVSIETNDKRFRFSFAKQESNIQIISVNFSNTESADRKKNNTAAELAEKIRIKTNLPEQEFLVIDAAVQILPNDKSKVKYERSAGAEPPSLTR